MTSATAMTTALPTEHRDRLLRLAREVSFDAGTRLFEEGRHADHFWIIRTGTVALDLHVPGRRPAVIESIGRGELVGWSWHFPPFTWHLGAEAMSPVRAWEFDAVAVRAGVCRGSGVRPGDRGLGRPGGRPAAPRLPDPAARPLRPLRQRWPDVTARSRREDSTHIGPHRLSA